MNIETAVEDFGVKKRIEFKRIQTLSQLIDFENKLDNDSFKHELLDNVCNTFRNMKKFEKSHRRFAYKIIDTFTKRKLYLVFSWSDKRSRRGKKNASLEKHSIFIDFIFQAIQKKMPRFRVSELEDVFQTLCRNKNSQIGDSSSEDVKT